MLHGSLDGNLFMVSEQHFIVLSHFLCKQLYEIGPLWKDTWEMHDAEQWASTKLSQRRHKRLLKNAYKCKYRIFLTIIITKSLPCFFLWRTLFTIGMTPVIAVRTITFFRVFRPISKKNTQKNQKCFVCWFLFKDGHFVS